MAAASPIRINRAFVPNEGNYAWCYSHLQMLDDTPYGLTPVSSIFRIFKRQFGSISTVDKLKRLNYAPLEIHSQITIQDGQKQRLALVTGIFVGTSQMYLKICWYLNNSTDSANVVVLPDERFVPISYLREINGVERRNVLVATHLIITAPNTNHAV